MISKDYLMQIFSEFEWTCDEKTAAAFDQYAEMLVDWNKKINLTAIVEPDEIVVKHFADSLLFLKAFDPAKGASLIDVGTGAGFPSLPVCLMRPDLRPTLLDSLQKRLHFLEEVCTSLSVPARFLHARAEEAGTDRDHRERYDVATARAVAHLRELSEYCLPFVRVGGVFVALKGYEIEEELAQAEFAIGEMGGKVESVRKFDLPDGSRRSILVIKKVRPTLPKYPRMTAKIKKSPLEKRG